MIKSDCFGLLDDLSCCILIKIGDDLEYLYFYFFVYYEDIDIFFLGGVFFLFLVYKCYFCFIFLLFLIVLFILVKELVFFLL